MCVLDTEQNFSLPDDRLKEIKIPLKVKAELVKKTEKVSKRRKGELANELTEANNPNAPFFFSELGYAQQTVNYWHSADE